MSAPRLTLATSMPPPLPPLAEPQGVSDCLNMYYLRRDAKACCLASMMRVLAADLTDVAKRLRASPGRTIDTHEFQARSIEIDHMCIEHNNIIETIKHLQRLKGINEVAKQP